MRLELTTFRFPIRCLAPVKLQFYHLTRVQVNLDLSWDINYVYSWHINLKKKKNANYIVWGNEVKRNKHNGKTAIETKIEIILVWNYIAAQIA